MAFTSKESLVTNSQQHALQQPIADRARAFLVCWYGEAFERVRMGDPIPAHVSRFWFHGGAVFDKMIRTNFGDDLKAMALGQYDAWLTLDNPLNALAGVILADQMTRNAFRGTPKAFSLDGIGRAWAAELLESGRARLIPIAMRAFLALPFVHSELLEEVQRSLDIYASDFAEAQALSPPANPRVAAMLRGMHYFADQHLQVIEQYGRYPHRNAILGRVNTPAEAARLADGTMPTF